MDPLDQNELFVKQVLQKDKKNIFEPNHQALAAVLRAAHDVPEMKKSRKPMIIAALSATLSVVVVAALIFQNINGGHTAFVNQHVLVNMDFKNMGNSNDIVRGEIELPDGIEFYSQKYPEIKAQRKLDFEFGNVFEQGQFPFVVQTLNKGVKEIKVKFYNSQNQVVAERAYRLKVKDQKQGVVL